MRPPRSGPGVPVAALGWLFLVAVGRESSAWACNQSTRPTTPSSEVLKLGALSDGDHGWIEHGGRFGVRSPGVVFVIAGVFLILAALRSDEQESGASAALSRRSSSNLFRNLLLGIVAVGLVAYGLLMIAVARYRSIAPSDAL